MRNPEQHGGYSTICELFPLLCCMCTDECETIPRDVLVGNIAAGDPWATMS